MNEDPSTERPCCRQQPCECECGDWVVVESVPDWPVDCEAHDYVLPGQVMVQPWHQLPAAMPVVSWHFHLTRVSLHVSGWSLCWRRVS